MPSRAIASYGVAWSRLPTDWQGSTVKRRFASTLGDAADSQSGASSLGEVLRGRRKQGTHIWVPPDLLEGLVVEVAGVTDQAADDVICVLEALKGFRGHGKLGALAEFHALVLSLDVDALHPLVVLLCILDVVLENDNVGVGNDLINSGRRHNRGSLVVDGAHGQG